MSAEISTPKGSDTPWMCDRCGERPAVGPMQDDEWICSECRESFTEKVLRAHRTYSVLREFGLVVGTAIGSAALVRGQIAVAILSLVYVLGVVMIHRIPWSEG